MKKRLQFTKMHGLGNDFILVDGLNQRIDETGLSEMAKTMCDRNFGIGADGLILVLASEECDFKMRIINNDGSEPQMCGNGIRCFARFVYENQLTEKQVFSVETLAGVIVPALVMKKGRVVSVEVDMGQPILKPLLIPVKSQHQDAMISEPMKVNGLVFDVTAVSMGNPHAVIFVDDLKSVDLETLGPLFAQSSQFPEGVNTEFVQILSPKECVLVVWERGAGETLACGTGACAAVVAGILNQRLERRVLVHLPGGDLTIEWQPSDDRIIMTGPATSVFSGRIEI